MRSRFTEAPTCWALSSKAKNKNEHLISRNVMDSGDCHKIQIPPTIIWTELKPVQFTGALTYIYDTIIHNGASTSRQYSHLLFKVARWQ